MQYLKISKIIKDYKNWGTNQSLKLRNNIKGNTKKFRTS